MPEVLSASGSALAIGDKIMVQYTSQATYPATVVELDAAKGICKVHWEDYAGDDEWRKGSDCSKVMEEGRKRRGAAAPAPVAPPAADPRPKPAKKPKADTESGPDDEAAAASKAARKAEQAARKAADEAARKAAKTAELEGTLASQSARASASYSLTSAAAGGAGTAVPPMAAVLSQRSSTGTSSGGAAAAKGTKPSGSSKDAASSSSAAGAGKAVAPRIRSSSSGKVHAVVAAVPAAAEGGSGAAGAAAGGEVNIDRRSTVRSDASTSIIIGLAWEAAGKEVGAGGNQTLVRLLSSPAPAIALATQLARHEPVKPPISAANAADAADAADAAAAAGAIGAVKAAAAGGADYETTVAAASAKLLAASERAWPWSGADQLLRRATVTRTRELYLASSAVADSGASSSSFGSSSSSSSSSSAAAAASATSATSASSQSALAGSGFEGESMFSPLLSLASIAAIHECAAAAREGVQMTADVSAAQRAAAAARWSGAFCSLVPVASAFADPQAFAGPAAAASAASSSVSSSSAAPSASAESSILFPLDAGLELADAAATAAAAAGAGDAGRTARRGGPAPPSSSPSAAVLLGQHRAAARQLSDRLALCAVLLRLHAEVAMAVAASGRAWRPALGPAPESGVIAQLLQESEQLCALPGAAAAVRKRANLIASELAAPTRPATSVDAAAGAYDADFVRLPSPVRSRDFVQSLVERLGTPAAEATVPRLPIMLATLHAAAAGSGRSAGGAAASMAADDAGADDEDAEDAPAGSSSDGETLPVATPVLSA